MSAVSLPSGTSTGKPEVPAFAVGLVGKPALYLDRAEAGAAADEIDGTYIEWRGCLGRQVLTAEARAAAEAPAGQPKPEPEAAP